MVAAQDVIREATENNDRSHQESAGVRVKSLERELAARTKAEVRFDEGNRALYATDGSNYRMPPIGVVIPRSREDIIETVRVCREFGAPVLTRGGGTSLAGQCCNYAVMMDLSKYYRHILAIDPEKRLVRVEPGIVLDDVQKAVAPHGLIFGPNPATHNHCTIGGMFGNNSCGLNSLISAKYGLGLRTSDNVEEVEVLLYDGTIFRVGRTAEEELEAIVREGGRRGEIYRELKYLRDEYAAKIREKFPEIPRRVSGYNLDELLPEKGFDVARALGGSEGTCVVALEVTLKLVPRPKARSVLVLGYPDEYSAGDAVPEILPFKPIALEGIDKILVDDMRDHGGHEQAVDLLPEGNGWLFVEFGGDSREDCDAQSKKVVDHLKSRGHSPAVKYYDKKEDEEKLWDAREAGLGVTAFVAGKPDTWEGWEDSAVPPDKVGNYLRDFRALFNKYGYNPTLYGHYGQGCIHCRVAFDLVTEPGLKRWREFLDEAADLVVRYGGSLSGEHGDGQSRAELLPKMYGEEIIEAFRRFKSIWDPDWKMNPGKVVDPNPILSHLRLGLDYAPKHPETFFQFPADQGDFSRAVLRCVGVGECRREEGGTMCPSYRVTHEEMHSTRGRAHLLFEMLRGDLLKKEFNEPAVKEALDLCLSCKGCKGDCPVHVDVATYKAEFLAHYYRHRLRPVHAYAFGLIGRWVQIAEAMPNVANFFQRAPIFSDAMKALIGVAPERKIPRFASQTFKDWFFHRSAAQRTGKPVLLWADTFNNHYHPDVARAATRFLEGAGWNVIVPRQHLCCGRPLYDYGMLSTARVWLRQILTALRQEIRDGVPIVVLEPSCATVFRDELTNLLPNDEDAKRLSRQVFLLGEFVDRFMKDTALPKIAAKAVVHGHCHHKAVMKMDAEQRVLSRIGLDFEVLDSGCCGMAGAFGFEKDHYEVSIACGEQTLLPAVRQAPADTLVIANGFSCREQIAQTTERKALHLAHVLDWARRKAGEPLGQYPERHYMEEPKDPSRAQALLALGLGAAVIGGLAFLWVRSARSRGQQTAITRERTGRRRAVGVRR